MVIEQLLTSKFPNFKCEKAFNGAEAIQMLRDANNYELILMDCNMPVMDGFEATRKIRKIYKDAGPPIVALTAFDTEET